MKLTKKVQTMMDILENAFGEIDFIEPIAILRYDERIAKISPEIFNYDYGEKEKDGKPKSAEAEIEHKNLREFLKNIEADDVDVEITSEEDAVADGLEMILDSRDDDYLFDNFR
ncbi:MAG: hypothetical protein COB07_11885 [Sulfurovum sp.]|nr:MAG: hypothetical protein COB07_11885 [Sulfurovum sp.]